MITNNLKINKDIDTTLISLSVNIYNTLRNYVQSEVPIRFDLPESTDSINESSISVFLYNIHEDLELRTGQGRFYDSKAKILKPEYVNIRCFYLILYWDKPQNSIDGPATDADNETLKVQNQILNALLNTRSFPDLPASYTRILPPMEGLFSLGTFWQSLGNRPRLCLNYQVTIPIILTGQTSEVKEPISSINSKVSIKPQPRL